MVLGNFQRKDLGGGLSAIFNSLISSYYYLTVFGSFKTITMSNIKRKLTTSREFLDLLDELSGISDSDSESDISENNNSDNNYDSDDNSTEQNSDKSINNKVNDDDLLNTSSLINTFELVHNSLELINYDNNVYSSD